ncbi:YibE/F family protein [Sporosarcina aquimarina]|uniref:YibE/F family protein n=1 Tax=Sporosarcina aquimarina TaxID=114975 RepID=A0ABU4G1S9_9BACL|nr:YibE/F family protein [Sporosarcina aquimarina]MDW0110930.1 YibE/F family protein [Sporosarcina aquimarina]
MSRNIMKFRKMRATTIWLYSVLVLCCIGSIIFVTHNYSLYERPIAKVTSVEVTERTKATDVHNNEDELVSQQLVAVLQNGKNKGQSIELSNMYSTTGAYDQQYHVNNELFVSINEQDGDTSKLSGEVIDVKRDRYIVAIAWIFVFTLLIIGRKKGLLSLASFALNVMILSFALDLYIHDFSSSLLGIASICILLFASTSLLLINGFTQKTYAAIGATLIGTFVSLGIASLVIWLTSGSGLHYEEMQFLSRPYQSVFLAGLFIGSLGAIMDVAITISSSLFALYERNPDITDSELRASGVDIGKDIMGTITSILLLAYMSGSLPILILYLKNAAPLGFTLSINLSLEVARALAGGIGVVLTIPIVLQTVLFFIRRRRAAS